jgi:putative salt-induced outer membrane protein
MTPIMSPRTVARRLKGSRMMQGRTTGPLRIMVSMLFMLLLVAPLMAVAEEQDEGWSGTVRLGYLATSGNTDTDNLNARLQLEYVTGRWAHSGFAAAFGAREEERTTAEAYELGARTTFDVNPYDYTFVRLNWRKDKFSGYDQQFSQAVGYGRRLINQPRQTLNVEIGAGARQATLRDGERQRDAILRLGSDYEFRFTETSSFKFDLSMESGADNTFTEAVSAVRTQLLGRLGLVVSYAVRNNSSVPPDTTRTDTLSALSLEYMF